MSSAITTNLAVDDPLIQDADYRFDDVDRKYIDDQTRGIEQHLVDALIRGRHATYVLLTGSSTPVTTGLAVCQSSIDDGEASVINANGTNLTNAVTAFGVVIYGGNPGARLLIARGGILPPTITGLLPGAKGFVRVNTSTGKLERVPALTLGDFGIGTVDGAGYMHVVPGISSGSGGGGGTALPGGSNNDIQVNDLGVAFKGIGGNENDTLRRVGGTWVAEPGAEVPSGSAGDMVGLDGAGGLVSLGPPAAGGGGLPTGADGQILCHFSGDWHPGNVADYMGLGPSVTAGAGLVRMNDSVARIMVAGTKTILGADATTAYYACDSSLGNQAANAKMYASTLIELGIGSTKYVAMNGGLVSPAVPIIGQAGSPYGVHGTFTKAMADANQALASTDYVFNTIVATGAITANRTLSGFFAPTTANQAYTRIIDNQCTGAFNIILSTGTGATATVPNGTIRTAIFDSTGVRLTSVGAAGTGEANTMSSSGTGASIVQTKSGVNLPIKSFLGAGNIAITSNANDLTFSFTGTLGISNGGTGLTTIGAAGTVFTSNGSSGVWATIVDANVSLSAAIQGIKISPSFGSQNVLTNNFFGAGSGTMPTEGYFRGIANPGGLVVIRDGSGNNKHLIAASATEMFIGTDTAFTSVKQSNIRMYGQSYIVLGTDSTSYISLQSNNVEFLKPMTLAGPATGDIGFSSPYAAHGDSRIDVTGRGTSFALLPAEYANKHLHFQGTPGGGVLNITVPNETVGYTKTIWVDINVDVVINFGTGSGHLATFKSRNVGTNFNAGVIAITSNGVFCVGSRQVNDGT